MRLHNSNLLAVANPYSGMSPPVKAVVHLRYRKGRSKWKLRNSRGVLVSLHVNGMHKHAQSRGFGARGYPPPRKIFKFTTSETASDGSLRPHVCNVYADFQGEKSHGPHKSLTNTALQAFKYQLGALSHIIIL